MLKIQLMIFFECSKIIVVDGVFFSVNIRIAGEFVMAIDDGPLVVVDDCCLVIALTDAT
jgi:hypothetical protein